VSRRSAERRVRRAIERARELGDQGRDDEAARVLREAVAEHPDNAELRLLLAIELTEAAPEESVRELERAAELADDDPETLFRVASALRGMGAIKPSAAALRRVTEQTDEHFVFAADMAHLGGLLARDVGDDARAEPLLRAAFEAEPEMRGHGRWLAGLLIDHERYDEALDVVQAALEHRPGDEDLIGLRDWLLSERA
jgi:tetratricopeptide (TPR) repeat protein